MWLGPKAPHQPASSAPRHSEEFKGVKLPKTPSFNEKDVSDKPDWIRDNPRLGTDQVAYMEELRRKRLRSMLAVDDMIGDLFEALREAGELDNTYIFFTSDNGFHLGQHRLGAGKWTAYEEDIRVPLIVRGPGVPEGRTLQHMVLNNDLAPTFADLAGAEAPGFVDGRSLVPLLDDDPTPIEDWRQRFLIEAVAERGTTQISSFLNESEVRPLVTGDPLPNNWRRTSAAAERTSQEWGRPWLKALRTEDYLYVEYKTGERELYDLGKDPHQLDNEYGSAAPELKLRLEQELDALRQCSAQDCRVAERGDG
jgi:arylsulfatase A-like enzyme